MHFKSLRLKIILSSVICILTVGIFSNVYLYNYLSGIIADKADAVSITHLESVKTRINQTLMRFYSLGYTCSNDLDIARPLRYNNLKTVSEKNSGIKAQEKLWGLLESSSVKDYVTMIMVFNDDGIMVQPGNSRRQGSQRDIARIQELDLFIQAINGDELQVFGTSKSLMNNEDCFAYISPVYDLASLTNRGWLYIEINPKWIYDETGSSSNDNFFILDDNGAVFPSNNRLEIPIDMVHPVEISDIRIGNNTYNVRSIPLYTNTMKLVNYSDITFLDQDVQPILFTTIVVIATSLTVAVVLAIILSNLITRPLRLLMSRIGKIAENDLSFDPDIEKGQDEISQTGRMVNQMVGSIKSLLDETKEMYIQSKNSEIALLQSQVNPHFLYNTLDSIYWMANIQKNTGIVIMTKSLSSLLKNLAKGVGNKITLGEELSLLLNYVDIQLIRYAEVFQVIDNISPNLYKYTITKFTLQPIVENAIFHGIEPKGEYGTIILDAKENDGNLIITIQDDGVGMTPKELKELKNSVRNSNPSGLSGMGVSNVDSRLKLVYGSKYGLEIKSEKELFTQVAVHIPLEGENV